MNHNPLRRILLWGSFGLVVLVIAYRVLTLTLGVPTVVPEREIPTKSSQLAANSEAHFDTAQTIGEIPLPAGYQRPPATASSFAAYLRKLPLKPPGTPVYQYDGQEKLRQDVHFAVIDLDIGTRDLQQCADAIIRLRAEYLWSQDRYAEINFRFTNGFLAEYRRWRAGERIRVVGNEVTWVRQNRGTTAYADFRKYLDVVFAYAGTLSLARDMKRVTLADLAAGDAFVQGGSPGHGVMIVDLAVNESTRDTVVLLAQSYLPAQDMHLLRNPVRPALSPWYSIRDFRERIRTPEWEFEPEELRRF
jgi:hypothetical protein